MKPSENLFLICLYTMFFMPRRISTTDLFLVLYFALQLLAFLNITDAQLLNCNFDDQSFCNWANAFNGVEDDFDWRIGNQVSVDAFHSIPRTLTGSGYFAYVQGQFRSDQTVEAAKAWLRSPVIESLSSSGSLSFDYWKAAAPPSLQICTRDAGQSQLRCLDTISGLGQQTWVRRTIVIPVNPNAFQIIIAASGFRSAIDTLAIDDISFSTSGTLTVGSTQVTRANLGLLDTSSNNSRAAVPPMFYRTTAASTNPYSNLWGSIQQTYPTTAVLSPYESSTQIHYSEAVDSGYTVAESYLNQDKRPNNFDAAPVLLTAQTVRQPTFFRPKPDDRAVVLLPVETVVATTKDTSQEEPESKQILSAYAAIECNFEFDFCNWQNRGWTIRTPKNGFSGLPNSNDNNSRPTYAYLSAHNQQQASIRSRSFRLLESVFLELYVLLTDENTGQLTVYRDNASVWQTLGHKDIGKGWKMVRIPLSATNNPVSLDIVGDFLAGNQFIAVDDIRLTDANGKAVNCEAIDRTPHIRESLWSELQDSHPHTLKTHVNAPLRIYSSLTETTSTITRNHSSEAIGTLSKAEVNRTAKNDLFEDDFRKFRKQHDDVIRDDSEINKTIILKPSLASKALATSAIVQSQAWTSLLNYLIGRK